MSLFPIKYTCDSCGKVPRNPNTMLCICGGEFRANVNIGVPATTFEPHFCPTLRQHVTSWKDQEKKAKAFRSADHPEGFVLLQDNKKYIRQLKQTHKNREDIIADTYKKDGIKYPKGKQVNFDEQKGRFIDRTSKEPISNKRYSLPSKPLRVSEKVKVAAVFIGFMFLASSAFAKIPGVPYVTLTVKGVNYEVPIHRPDFTEPQAKIVLDMLDGDKNSRKLFLGGQKERIFFIGDDKPRWLHVTQKDEWVE